MSPIVNKHLKCSASLSSPFNPKFSKLFWSFLFIFFYLFSKDTNRWTVIRKWVTVSSGLSIENWLATGGFEPTTFGHDVN